MFAILGATGKVGGATARELRRRGLPVRAIVRDATSDKAQALAAAGCTLTIADIHDTAALTEALTGVSAALVLCPLTRGSNNTLAESAQRTADLGIALAQARPLHIVALSDYGAHHPTGTGVAAIFHRLEQHLRTSPSPPPSSAPPSTWKTGPASSAPPPKPEPSVPATSPLPAPSTIWSADLAAIAADLLTSSPTPADTPRVIHAEGPRRYTPAEMATTAAALADRPIAGDELPHDQWLPTLLARGLGETHAQLVTEMYAAHNAGKIEVEPGGEIRHGTTTLTQAYAALLGLAPVVTPPVRGCFS
ncbi:MAG: NAD(P)H-binding protein [Chloroflexia bacterium]